MIMRLTIGFLTALAASACGSGGNSGPDGGDGGLTCGPLAFALQGEVEGQPVAEQATVAGQALVNVPSGTLPCSLNLYFEGGGRLRLEWAQTAPNDTPTPATGSINLEAHGKLNYGACDTEGYLSEMTLLSSGVRFTLRKLHEAPYCTGAAVSGELTGCASFAP
jgi:hypothetical protein